MGISVLSSMFLFLSPPPAMHIIVLCFLPFWTIYLSGVDTIKLHFSSWPFSLLVLTIIPGFVDWVVVNWWPFLNDVVSFCLLICHYYHHKSWYHLTYYSFIPRGSIYRIQPGMATSPYCSYPEIFLPFSFDSY